MVESSQGLQDLLDIYSLSDLHLPIGAQGESCCLTGFANLVEPQPDYQRLPRNGGGGLTGGALLNPCVVAQGLPVPSFR